MTNQPTAIVNRHGKNTGVFVPSTHFGGNWMNPTERNHLPTLLEALRPAKHGLFGSALGDQTGPHRFLVTADLQRRKSDQSGPVLNLPSSNSVHQRAYALRMHASRGTVRARVFETPVTSGVNLNIQDLHAWSDNGFFNKSETAAAAQFNEPMGDKNWEWLKEAWKGSAITLPDDERVLYGMFGLAVYTPYTNTPTAYALRALGDEFQKDLSLTARLCGGGLACIPNFLYVPGRVGWVPTLSRNRRLSQVPGYALMPLRDVPKDDAEQLREACLLQMRIEDETKKEAVSNDRDRFIHIYPEGQLEPVALDFVLRPAPGETKEEVEKRLRDLGTTSYSYVYYRHTGSSGTYQTVEKIRSTLDRMEAAVYVAKDFPSREEEWVPPTPHEALRLGLLSNPPVLLGGEEEVEAAHLPARGESPAPSESNLLEVAPVLAKDGIALSEATAAA